MNNMSNASSGSEKNNALLHRKLAIEIDPDQLDKVAGGQTTWYRWTRKMVDEMPSTEADYVTDNG